MSTRMSMLLANLLPARPSMRCCAVAHTLPKRFLWMHAAGMAWHGMYGSGGSQPLSGPERQVPQVPHTCVLRRCCNCLPLMSF